MAGVLFALTCSALLPGQSVTGAVSDEVVAARHERVGEAIYSGSAGLILRREARADLLLGTGSDARFAADGTLWFVRSVDMGHAELVRAWWILAPDAVTPEPARPPIHPPAAPAPQVPESGAVRVCLDAGHGGADPGALGNGLRESDINLDVVLRLRDLMVLDTQDPSRGGTWNVLLTRSTDVDVSLGQRTSAANAFGAATFLSVHMNAFSSTSANGTETFCFTGTLNGPSGALAGEAQAEALARWQLTNRGVKTANFFVLRNTSMPAALLEGGFITNTVDAAVMAVPARRQELALGMLFALQRYHGFQVHDPGAGGGGTEALRGTVFDTAGQPISNALVATQGGAFTFTDAAGAYALDTNETGIVHVGATAAGHDAAWSVTFLVAGQQQTANLLMGAADVPRLAISPSDPSPGGPFVVQAEGDVGTPVVLILGLAPRLPTLDLRALGLGVVWPELGGSITVPVGIVGGSGLALAFLPTPAASGLILHAQALATTNGTPRLSNGAALRIR